MEKSCSNSWAFCLPFGLSQKSKTRPIGQKKLHEIPFDRQLKSLNDPESFLIVPIAPTRIMKQTENCVDFALFWFFYLKKRE